MSQDPRPNHDPLMGRDPALDGVRGISCMLVYFFHMGVSLKWPPFVVQGFVGVIFFFVLSGFLMFGPFAAAMQGLRPFPTLRSYSIRRFTRIYPPYFVALVVYTLARVATEAMRPGLTRSQPPGARNLLLHALMVFNYFDRDKFYSICGVFWSLAVEVQFYVLLPIGCAIAAWLGTRTTRGLLAFVATVAAIGIASRALEFRYYESHFTDPLMPRFVSITSYLDLFAAGMALVALSRTGDGARRVLSSRARWALFILGLAGFLAAENWSLGHARDGWQLSTSFVYTTFYPAISAGTAAMMMLPLISRPAVGAGLLTWGPIVRLGEISYSLYLYHILVQTFVGVLVHPERRYPGPWQGVITAMISLVPTLIVSGLAYYLVERPALAWGIRYSSHKAAAREILADTALKSSP